MMTGVRLTYTRLEESETLIDVEQYFFCKSTKIWGQTTWVFGTVEIGISLRFDKKYFG